MSKRVLLAGLFHETHTFLEQTTGMAEFQERRGAELWEAEGDGSPLGGVLSVARRRTWEVIPTIDLRATPSGTVRDEVVERFWNEFARVAEAEPADGIYLVLHGAMASQSYPDVEGEILTRIRKSPRLANLPLFGVLDLHANYSDAMAKYGDGFVAYRENPHTDAEAAAIDAAELLDRCLETGRRPVTVRVQPAIVWPPTGVGTADDPMRTLEKMAREIERNHSEILAVNVFAGYSFADTPDTGPSFSAVTLGDPAVAQREIQRLSDWAWEHRQLGNRIDPPVDSVMADVKAATKGPVLLVEPSDNIGGGAPGDGTGVLKALLAHGIQNAAVVINDPAAVAAAQSRKIGDRWTQPIGGRGSKLTSGPAELEIVLESVSDGHFDLEDRQSHLASMCGMHINMGPSAVVRAGGVRILLTTRQTPPFDLGQLRSQGIIPEEMSVIGVKAAVAHRRAYDPIQAASYTIDTPGPCSSNLRMFPFQKLRRPAYPIDG